MPRRASINRLLRPAVTVLALVMLGGALVPLYADAAPPHRKLKDTYRKQVEQLEETWRAAQVAGDVAAMDKLLSEDYVGITMNGQVVTKMQQLDRMRNRQVVVSKIVLDEVKVKLIGTTAIVNSLAQVDGTNDGESIHGTYRYTRVYSRLPSGTWKITNFEATRVGPPPPPRDSRHPGPRDQGSKDPRQPDCNSNNPH
jgi:ketosteroid isomerase-like protein